MDWGGAAKRVGGAVVGAGSGAGIFGAAYGAAKPEANKAWNYYTGGKDKEKAEKEKADLEASQQSQASELQKKQDELQAYGDKTFSQLGSAQKTYQGATAQALEDYKSGRNKIDVRANAADQAYAANSGTNEAGFQQAISSLNDEAAAQAKDASQVYSNSVRPAFQNIMEDAQINSNNAMSLADYNSPTNSQTFKNVSGTYNQAGDQALAQGANIYNQYAGDIKQQTQGVRKQGLSDYGVLAAMGAQATGSQMAPGVPMTAGQQQALMAGNQRQAGEAYANAQRRVQSLEDQRRQQDIAFGAEQRGTLNQYKQAGLTSGLAQTNAAYGAGQTAKNRYSNSVKDLQDAESTNNNQQGALRNERAGYGKETLASKTRVNDVKHATDWAALSRDYGNISEDSKNKLAQLSANYNMDAGTMMAQLGFKQGNTAANTAILNQVFSQQQATIGADINAANSAAAAKAAGVSNIFGTVGAVVGGMYGGPAGAAAGQQGGQATGNIATGGNSSPTGNPYAPGSQPMQQQQQPGWQQGQNAFANSGVYAQNQPGYYQPQPANNSSRYGQ